MITINLFNLVARLSLDSDDYNAKIEEAKKKGQDLADTTQKKHSVAMVAGWMAVATAVIAVIKRVTDLALATMQYADQVGDLAEQWGFTTKQIQEFDYWATQNGTTLEALLTGMRGLVNQAQAGSEAFDKLGVSVKNTDGTLKDQRTLFLETITALQRIENQTERNALQFDIFGRSGVSLGQIINKSGAELEALSQKAEDYGLIISESAIKASSDFNDELDTMKRRAKAIMAELFVGDPEVAFKNFENFFNDVLDKVSDKIPEILRLAVTTVLRINATIMKNLPHLLSGLLKEILNYDWAGFGWDLAKEIFVGLAEGLWEMLQTLVGKGWLWGKDNPSAQVEAYTSSSSLNTITSANVSEKTTKVDEKLDITLSVESDGTVAGQQNLDVISDLLTDKINKALGDMVNG